MLQNNSAVINLQYDSDLRIAQQNRVEPICKVFDNKFYLILSEKSLAIYFDTHNYIIYICVTDPVFKCLY